MAGAKAGVFKELITPFLRRKMDELRAGYGEDSPEYNAIARQYVKSDLENAVDSTRQRRRHYEAEVRITHKGRELKGVERLYRRTVLLEPTTACAAHCRWCLRGQYDIMALSSQDVLANLEYFASLEDVSEILITGGEPLVAVPQLEFVLDNIEKLVPQIEIVRIGARLLTQAPEKLTDHLLSVLSRKRRYRVEIGVHIAHPVEFWDETIEKIRLLREAGIRLYNQHPLLKGVNDNEQALIGLYDLMRKHDVESHYMFHCIPMQGMDHHRTRVERGLELVSALTAGGHFSGRSKPIYTAMTDIGKISLFQGSIVKRSDDGESILLRSSYRYEDRKSWNPSWEKPEWCEVDDAGYLSVWYPDGTD
jgi:lysine 2,3-aminomutase